MLGRTHQVIGLTVGLASFLYLAPATYQPATFAAVLVFSHLLSLLPDVDQPLSDFWRGIPAGRFVSGIPASVLQHRNLTHSLLGVGLVYWGMIALGKLVPPEWGLNWHLVLVCAMAAYVSHLLADMVTIEGVPVLFPHQRMYGIPPRPFQGVRIVTGKWFENLVVFPLVNIAFVVIVWLYRAQIHVILHRT
jgi:membrane-bound metal-dependent hydrolase YbcI (DUF457 family)